MLVRLLLGLKPIPQWSHGSGHSFLGILYSSLTRFGTSVYTCKTCETTNRSKLLSIIITLMWFFLYTMWFFLYRNSTTGQKILFLKRAPLPSLLFVVSASLGWATTWLGPAKSRTSCEGNWYHNRGRNCRWCINIHGIGYHDCWKNPRLCIP